MLFITSYNIDYHVTYKYFNIILFKVNSLKFTMLVL